MSRRALSLLPVLACTACVYSGTVTAKGHDEEQILPMTSMVCGANGACTPVVTTQVYPECWRLELVDGHGLDAPTGSVCVDQTVWDTIQVGQYYRDPS
jgi:hypothetical protein